jgi:hypothetical protein
MIPLSFVRPRRHAAGHGSAQPRPRPVRSAEPGPAAVPVGPAVGAMDPSGLAG